MVLKAVDAQDPPLHLPLGPIAYDIADKKLRSFRETIDAWRDVAIATNFD